MRNTKKFRINQDYHGHSGRTAYFVEKRVFFFGWKRITRSYDYRTAELMMEYRINKLREKGQ